MNHCLRRWICICSRCPIVCRWCTIILVGFCRWSTRKLVTLQFSNPLKNMTFPHDMLLECTKTSFSACNDVTIRFTKNSANGFFWLLYFFLIQSFSKMTSGSLDVHVIFGRDFLTSFVTVFSNHSHLHLFARPASKPTHPSQGCWKTCCKTYILFCTIV